MLPVMQKRKKVRKYNNIERFGGEQLFPFFLSMTDEEKKAYSYAIKLLTGRDYSKPKLRQKLRERQYSAESINQVIAELERLNFIREDLYIEARIKGFMFKRCSPSYIVQKLAQESISIDESLVDQLFAEYSITVEQQILELIKKKCPTPLAIGANQLNYEEREKLKNKVLRYLASKGHSFALSIKMLDDYLRSIQE